jgi:hypothetical protein
MENWHCVGVTDYETDNYKCELCGCENVRYIHRMIHDQYPDELKVGCVCAGIMEDDILAAKERDAEAKRRSKRRLTFFKKDWTVLSDEQWFLKYKRRNIYISQDSFRGKAYYKIDIDGEQYHWQNNSRIVSFVAAKKMVFDLIDNNSTVKSNK